MPEQRGAMTTRDDRSRPARSMATVLAVPDATRKGNQAYDLMRREIVACRLLPGTRFTEAEVMERFEIGKASCRIALQRLAQEGFVSSMPRHGYRVSPVTVKDVDEVFALRMELEPLAARGAAGRVNRAHLERLEQACRRKITVEMGNQIDFFLEANRGFHLAIAAAAGNGRLYRTLSGLLDEMTRLVALGFGVQGVRPNIENDHTAMIEHLVAGDADSAALVARRHVETFRDMTLEKVIASLRDTAVVAPVRTSRAEGGEP
ncbi:putative HTH-type transcriptional regulator YdhC [Methylobacterium phyllosphaerae]|uniref:DNA-binding transcriptional regulator, GntR family n=3 Tax=Methylobacteriaceae TaxID=119045 RepID=A0AAE8L8N8_9HYPH|nr:putative HTH-type transcriptional regulator YdhC [Methylobacterium phyllosphaerae]SFH44411.1 DNA-binding transcriptional regulator, GntR family [Methylobacterium phyllosphaerae]